MTTRSTRLALVIGASLAAAACGKPATDAESAPAARSSSPPPASSPAPTANPTPSPPRNAGVLVQEPDQYGGLAGSPADPIPGLPPIPPRGPCEDAIAHVRQLACKAGVERVDGPLVHEVRDALIEGCGAGGGAAAAALRCVDKAAALNEVRACPRAARPAHPNDCEAIRLHVLSLTLVDETCPGSSPPGMAKWREDYSVASTATWLRGDREWKETCEKAAIPASAVRCVLAARTMHEFTDCGL